VSDVATTEILDAYAALGGNLVDTADSYSDGRSEQLIGEWMTRRRNRDEMVVATKIGKSSEHPGLSAPAIAAAVEASLRRLGTDRIDLLYLHIDDVAVPFEETLLAVDDLIRSGKVRTFGMSDHTGNRLLAARVACALMGVAPMTALQNEYSLMRRGYEGDLQRVAAQQGLAVMPRFPLAGGFLTGAYRSKADLASSQAAEYIAPHLRRRGRRVLAVLEKVAASHDAAPATVALAWLLTRQGVVAPVVSVSSADQLFDVMSGPDIRLTRQQLSALDRVSA
jgi:aryl-alcohol dehydrogenase-like predicted oxidoreductase